MEDSGKTTIKESTENISSKEPIEEQNGEATGEVSSQMSNPETVRKPSGEARFSRLKLFNKVMQKSMEKFIDHARFASTFLPLYKQNPRRMEIIHKQFIEDLRKNIQEDINRLIEEGQLECKLDELDKLESAAKNNPEPAWRPSGVPEQDLCSFLIPYYQKQEAYLRRELKKIRAENAALAQNVQNGRESITQTENHISTAVDEWKASVTQYERLASSLCPADVFDV